MRSIAADNRGDFFTPCDGYGHATAGGDGMTKWASAILVFNLGGDTRRSAPAFAEPYGIGACGAAISELDAKFPEFWRRKASLLRARAIHRLVIGDPSGALRDLDASDALAANKPDDVYYDRSLKLGSDLVRAQALRQSGDAAKAEKLAMLAWAKRPYSREAGYSTLIAIGPEAPLEDREKIMRTLAQITPEATGQWFTDAFEHGRFTDALEIYPGLQAPIVLGNTPMNSRDALLLKEGNRKLGEIFWVQDSGSYAYALAALGRVADSRAAIHAAKTRLAAAMVDLPDAPAEASLEAKTVVAIHNQTNLEMRTYLPSHLDGWTSLVEARIAIDEGRFADAAAAAKTIKVPRTWAVFEFTAALSANDPSRSAQAKARADAMRAQHGYDRTTELKGLFKSLPETETQERIAAYRQDFAWLGVQWGPKSGFTLEEHPADGFTTIKFESPKAPLSLLEDMALLKAADIARQAGKAGLVILDRRNINHIINNGMAARGSLLSGYESQLDFVAVDPTAPPPAYQNARWRIVDANAVYGALAPLYIPSEQSKGH